MGIPPYLYEVVESETRNEFYDKYANLNDFIEPKDNVSYEYKDFRFEFDNKYKDFELYWLDDFCFPNRWNCWQIQFWNIVH